MINGMIKGHPTNNRMAGFHAAWFGGGLLTSEGNRAEAWHGPLGP
jgi:hypothetical protein